MPTIELPFVAGDPNYQVGTTLNGDEYIFAMFWNAREDAWRMSVFEVDNTPIAQGLKVVLGAYIGRRVNHPLFLNGVFVAVDLSTQEADATFYDMGIRVIVKYIPVLDLIVNFSGS